MKAKFLLIATAMVFSQAALADDGENCDVDQIEDSPNVIIEVITIPFKMLAVLTYGPRCLIDSIPKNE